jgi:PadR family transcriptional regulator, regulatory protein AphA
MSVKLSESTSHSRTRFLILGLLSEAPMSGYDIAHLTKLRFRFFWSESYGQIYPELKRLSAEGLIEGSAGGGGRGKRQWTLTEAGRAALEAWLADSESSDTARLETLLKVYFSFASPKALRKTATAFAVKMETEIKTLKEAEVQLRTIPDPHHNHGYALAAVDFGLATYRVWRDWAKKWAKEGI